MTPTVAEQYEASVKAVAAFRHVEGCEMPLDAFDTFVVQHAIKVWHKDDLIFYIVENPLFRDFQELAITQPELVKLAPSLLRFGRYNGYVIFPQLPFVAPGTGGITHYVPVHGSITFAELTSDGRAIYGFDTAHASSIANYEIVDDIGWMVAECEAMGRAIKIAARFEPYYLRANDDNDKKARVLRRLGKFLPIQEFNMGLIVNMLFGDL